jgi:hypothetical protein
MCALYSVGRPITQRWFQDFIGPRERVAGGGSPASESLSDLLPGRLGLMTRTGPGVRRARTGPALAVLSVQPLLVHAPRGFTIRRHIGVLSTQHRNYRTWSDAPG